MKQYISFLLLVFTGLSCWSCKDDVERPALVTSEIELAVPKNDDVCIVVFYNGFINIGISPVRAL